MRRTSIGYLMIGLIVVAASLAPSQTAQAIWSKLAALGFEPVGGHACTDGITFRLSDLRLSVPPFRTYTANHVVITDTASLAVIKNTALAPIPANPIKIDFDGFGTYEDYGYSGYYTLSWSTTLISGNSVQLDFIDPQTSKPDVLILDCVVADLPRIQVQPGDRVIEAGQTTALSVGAIGEATLSYQWYQGVSGDTTTPVGTDSPSFTTPALSENTDYWVRVSNSWGSVDSHTATAMIASEHVYLPLIKR